jgi:hypothetical protein
MANELIIKNGFFSQGDSDVTGSLQVSGSIGVTGSGSAVLSVYGSQGNLLVVTDSFSGSLFTVTDISGYPLLDVSSGSVDIVNPVIVTGSLAVNNGSNVLDTSQYLLEDGSPSIDWSSRILNDGNQTSIDWTNRTLQDSGDTISIDWESRVLYASDGSTQIDWSNSSYIALPSINESSITNILGIDNNGRLYYTASSAIGGGGSAFPYTGSAIITGSLTVTGSVNSTLGFTGSLQGTSSWAQSASQAVSASFALTSSRAVTASQFTGPAGETISSDSSNNLFYSANRHFITASNTIRIGAINGVSIDQGTLSTGFLSVNTITNSPLISGNNYLYGTSVNTTLTILPSSTGSLQLGRSIYLASPSNGTVDIYGGVNIALTSSKVELVGRNTILTLNAPDFTGNITQISSSQIVLDGTHPSGSVLFVTSSTVPTGAPANVGDVVGNGLNRAAVQFAKSGSGDNYLLYVYIGGRWRSSSLA